ncbi:hypothetical protein BD310DRAFT_917404 [Dichomitus squalens]|uniref:Uncharacterized protein n=1 Tax=Dichomitus squalens TaxID=114155 RepID=A0A4Q9Q6Z9_9APHY|nr:hypothetical protein BD310DRAFT_917404 [Dichomitus squalens]
MKTRGNERREQCMSVQPSISGCQMIIRSYAYLSSFLFDRVRNTESRMRIESLTARMTHIAKKGT